MRIDRFILGEKMPSSCQKDLGIRFGPLESVNNLYRCCFSSLDYRKSFLKKRSEVSRGEVIKLLHVLRTSRLDLSQSLHALILVRIVRENRDHQGMFLLGGHPEATQLKELEEIFQGVIDADLLQGSQRTRLFSWKVLRKNGLGLS